MTQIITKYLVEQGEKRGKTYAKRNEKIKISFLLCLCLITGSILRLWGIEFGLPFFHHPDEGAYLPMALDILSSSDLNPDYFRNPPLLTYVYTITMFLYFVLGKLFGWFQSMKDFQELYLLNMTIFFVIARTLNTLLSVGICLLVYKVGKTLFDKITGLIASLLACSTFLLVRDSHYAVNDIPGTFFLILSFSYIVGIYTRGRLKDYMLGGLFAGIAVATKYNMGIVILPLVLAHLLATKKIAITRKFMWAVLGCLIGFALVCPWSLLDYRNFWKQFVEQALDANASGVGGGSTVSYGRYIAALIWGYGLLPMGLFIIGAIRLWREKETEKLLLILCFPLYYYSLLGGIKLFFVRFAIPLIPYLCILSACGVIFIARRISYRSPVVVLVPLTLVAISQGVIFSCQHNCLISKTDTRILAYNWIDNNLPHGSKIVTEGYCPSLQVHDNRNFLTENINNHQVESVWTNLPTVSLIKYKEQKFQYIITSSYINKRYLDHPLRYPTENGFYTTLRRETNQIFQISPAQGKVPFYFDEVYSPFWNLFVLERPGPTITIFEID